jgi:hypothetical protein
MPLNQQQTAATGLSLDQFDFESPIPRRGLPAWLMSCVLHLVLMLLLAFVVRDVTSGAVDEPQRTAGIVLVQQAKGTTEYLSEQDVDAASEAPATASEAARPIGSSLPKETELPFDVAGLLPSGEFQGFGAGADIADALPGVGDLTIGAGPSKRFGGKTKTYVFGVEGEGSVFIYVFDRSESMSGFQGRPLAAAKSQLIKSIHSLGPTNQFQIFFYNNRLSAFNPNHPQQPQLIFADDSGKTLAEDFVRKIQASGGTEHMAALRAALRLGPDVIFFLTDAADPALSPDELREVTRLNKGTVINAIEFGAGPFPGGDNFLMKLARQNDGQHTYVDVDELPSAR